MTFTITQGDDAGSLRLVGELDVAETDGLLERATSALPTDGDLVLELDELTFIDSSGVRALVTIAGMLRSGRLVLADPTPAVRRVLDLVEIEEAAAGIEVRTADGSDQP
jgi:anti-anti-sigma factor